MIKHNKNQTMICLAEANFSIQFYGASRKNWQPESFCEMPTMPTHDTWSISSCHLLKSPSSSTTRPPFTNIFFFLFCISLVIMRTSRLIFILPRVGRGVHRYALWYLTWWRDPSVGINDRLSVFTLRAQLAQAANIENPYVNITWIVI